MAVATNLVASKVWKQLHGLLCVYKPTGVSLGRMKANLKLITSAGLNKMIVRQPRKIIQYDATLGLPMESIETDYSDHPLVIGPRYETEDIHLYCASSLNFHSSGVCVVGLNRGTYLAQELQDSKPLRVYHLYGQLGIATNTLFKTGKVIERASYSRVFRPHIDKVVASMQASHQRFMYTNSGVHIQSQEAYDLAVKGLLRPEDDNVPIIYGIKCIYFERPFFTIEVSCTNEREDYLLNLIHTIGMRVKSVATCNSIKCVRYGPFTLEHSLVPQSWSAEKFALNVQVCNAINEADLESGRRDSAILTPLSEIQDSESEAPVDSLSHSPESLQGLEDFQSK